MTPLEENLWKENDSLKARAAKLEKLLQESYDHHDYCGWERECAINDELPKRMQEALDNKA